MLRTRRPKRVFPDGPCAAENHHDVTRSVGDAVRPFAHPGGYRGRKHGPEPVHQILWHGALGREIGYRSGFDVGFRADRQPDPDT